jgi:hypothetical protein
MGHVCLIVLNQLNFAGLADVLDALIPKLNVESIRFY